MSNYGPTAAQCNYWLNASARNTPWAAPITTFQLHIGAPGPVGTANLSAVTARQAAAFTAGVNGGISITGALPQWQMTAEEILTAVSIWSGFDGDSNAVCLYTLGLITPETVAAGDIYQQNSANLTFLGQAA